MHFNNGKTLYSLFKEWPANNIAQLYFQRETPDSDKFTNYFRITDYEILEVIFKFKSKHACGETISPERSFTKINYKLEPRIKLKVLNFIKNNINLLILSRNILYWSNIWRSKKLIAWLDDFNPQVIFFLGGNFSFSFRITEWIAKKFKIPYVIYLTDDYIFNKTKSNFIGKMVITSLERTYKKSFLKASKICVIGQQMAREFESHFGKKFIPIMNSIEFESDKIPVVEENISKKMLIVFTGGLHLNRWKKLLEFGLLIKECEEKLSMQITVEIYSIHPPDETVIRLLNIKPLKYCGALVDSELKAKLSKADFLLHVESDEKYYRELTRLSVSTKISEYLARTKCVIAFGPFEVASIRLFSDNHIGLCLTDKDSHNEKINKLMSIFSSPELGKTFALNGFEFSYKHFNAATNRRVIKELLNDAIKKYRTVY